MLLILASLAQIVATLGGLDQRWLTGLAAPPAAPAAYDLQTAYVPLRDGPLVAVELERGGLRWQRALTTTIAPSAGGGMVFVATDGMVEALDAASGVTRWRTPIPGRVLTVTWDTGWVLCSTEAGDLAALRAADGELLWRTTLTGALVTNPAAGLDRVYVGLEGARVVSVELATGRQAWARVLEGRVTGLASADGQLIVGTTANAVYSLDLKNGRQRWRWRVGGDVSGPAASDARHIYFAARDNVLRAVDRGNGNLRWTAELSSRPVGGPQTFGEAIAVPLANAIALFDAEAGTSLGTIAASGEISSAPHLRPNARPTGAVLVALTRDGRLQGFGARIESPPAALEALPGVAVVP